MDEDNKQDVQEVNREEEYLNNWKRARADFVNYKKDETKRMEQFVKFANEDVILEVLDVVGNLELAAAHLTRLAKASGVAREDAGLKQVIKQFESLFKKYGVERIAVAGQKFDPAVHEAVDAIDESKPLAEVRAGYTMHGRVIRPARVNNGQDNSTQSVSGN